MLFLCSLAEVSLCSGSAYGTVGADTARGLLALITGRVSMWLCCLAASDSASVAYSGADCGDAVGTADRESH